MVWCSFDIMTYMLMLLRIFDIIICFTYFGHHDIFLTLWHTLLTSWCIFWYHNVLSVLVDMSYFLMTYSLRSWCGNKFFLTSWRTLLISTCGLIFDSWRRATFHTFIYTFHIQHTSWFHDVRLDIMTYVFWTLWHFCYVLTTSWFDILFDIMTYFLTLRCTFWHVMTYFRCHDVDFYVMPNIMT